MEPNTMIENLMETFGAQAVEIGYNAVGGFHFIVASYYDRRGEFFWSGMETYGNSRQTLSGAIAKLKKSGKEAVERMAQAESQANKSERAA